MSQIGPLLDISAGGMRIKFDKGRRLPVHSVLNFQIQTAFVKFSVRGVVAWVRRGQGGIQFIDLSAEHAAMVDYITRFAKMPEPGEAVTARRGTAKPRPDPASALPPPVTVSVEMEDLYAILGVARSADPATIKSAYHRLARQCHPDLSSKPDQNERFTVISKAFSVLRDPDLRKRYDEMLSRSAA